MWTIVTPTMGRESLLTLKERLKHETVPYVHLVMMDEKKVSNALTKKEIEDDRTFVYEIRHPLHRQPGARMDVYLRGVGISMARTPFIRCCDDDAWPEPDHLRNVTDFLLSKELDFCWCKRKMYTRSGDLIGVDNFEAIGVENKFGYHLLDNSSLFFNRNAAKVLIQVFLDNPIYGDDRLTWAPLQKYCKGMEIPAVLTNHMAQPELEAFFRSNCDTE